MVKFKAEILNKSVGRGRVVRIECSHGEEQKVINLLRKAGMELDIRRCNW